MRLGPCSGRTAASRCTLRVPIEVAMHSHPSRVSSAAFLLLHALAGCSSSQDGRTYSGTRGGAGAAPPTEKGGAGGLGGRVAGAGEAGTDPRAGGSSVLGGDGGIGGGAAGLAGRNPDAGEVGGLGGGLDEDELAKWRGEGGRDVTELIQSIVDDVNVQHSRFEQIKRFTILPRDFTLEDGEVTPTMKLKRRVCQEHFAAEIEALYS